MTAQTKLTAYLLAFTWAAVAAFTIPAHAFAAYDLDVRPATPGADTSVAGVLSAEHGCWSGDGPEGITPTRAVVELDARKGPVLADAAVGFGIWLDHKPGTLYAFCP